jgi:hypothetical protein
MAAAKATVDHAGMSSLLPGARRLGLDTVYLALGLPIGILAFTWAVTGWALSLGWPCCRWRRRTAVAVRRKR